MLNQKVNYLFLITLFPFFCVAQNVLDLPQASPRAAIRQRIGLTDMEVDYSRPAVNGRKIWGDIVPYGFTLPTVDGKDKAPWKTGANMNTTLSFTHEVMIEGQKVKAGKYGYFVAVHEDGTATLVLSKTNGAYGQYFYREEEGVIRAVVQTRSVPHTARLTFSFDEVGPMHAVLSLKWDELEIPVKITVNVHEIVVASLTEQLKHPATFTWHGRVQAIRYLIDNNIRLDLALQWADEALEGSPGGELLTGERNFTTLTTKYHVLNALQREPEAKIYLKEAMANPGSVQPARVASFANNLLSKNRKQDAQQVLDWSIKKWPGSWEVKHGMAHLYSLEGKYIEALKLENEVYQQIPQDQKERIADNIKLLKQNKTINL
jgi:tetratricopeptide (TPR) repeat protein